jgi:phosphoribosylformylglycinamidine synthase I
MPPARGRAARSSSPPRAWRGGLRGGQHRPKVLILHATGTNRDREALQACEMAGGRAEIVHVNQLADGSRRLADYQMLVLPGGFSYGDDLGAGRIWASDLAHMLHDQVTSFVEAGKPVIGICNGFQALVKAGWLPGRWLPGPLAGVAAPKNNAAYAAAYAGTDARNATLTFNGSNRFECRWVWLEADPESPCVFTRGISELIYCPVAHGEGRFVPRDDAVLAALAAERRIAVRYVVPDSCRADGSPAKAGPADYPHNPNGSVAGIAGICNAPGTVFGLMPHPEDHIFPEQHPRWARGETGNLGLALFENGIRYAAET